MICRRWWSVFTEYKFLLRSLLFVPTFKETVKDLPVFIAFWIHRQSFEVSLDVFKANADSYFKNSAVKLVWKLKTVQLGATSVDGPVKQGMTVLTRNIWKFQPALTWKRLSSEITNYFFCIAILVWVGCHVIPTEVLLSEMLSRWDFLNALNTPFLHSLLCVYNNGANVVQLILNVVHHIMLCLVKLYFCSDI